MYTYALETIQETKTTWEKYMNKNHDFLNETILGFVNDTSLHWRLEMYFSICRYID